MPQPCVKSPGFSTTAHSTLREAVTSPAGTTINAIREMENHGVRAAMLSALEAARDRGRELAAGGEDKQ